MKYDVFISYRREGGAATARILRDRLTDMGYRVFFDLESLRSGYFNTALYSVIDQCKDVIVVLSPDSLDRCVNEDDWVRKEVEHALQRKKNVIPVLLRGFRFPDTLPDSIDSLRYCNGIEASEDFFDAFVEKLTEFMQAKPVLFRGLMQNRSLKRFLPALVAAVLVLGAFLGIRSLADSEIYPRTAQEKNLTQEMVYYVSRNLTHFDVLAETYSQALESARRYLSVGMTDDSAMESQFAITRQQLEDTDVSAAAPASDFLAKLADSPFDTAEVQAMHDNVISFRKECIHNLDYLEQMLAPDYYPRDPARKLEILEQYEKMLEENMKIFGYGGNQILLPITKEEALEEFWHEQLPYLTNLPLRATNWSRDYDALQSAIEESLQNIEKCINNCALIVGDSAAELEQMEKDILQDLVDQGYTQETAEKIWAYQTEDPEDRRARVMKEHLDQGYTQTEAETLTERKLAMLEAQAKMRIGYGARTTDDVETLWEKMTYLLAVDLYEEALECGILYQQQMSNSDNYLPGIQLFIHIMQQTELDSGIMVMEYYEPDGINEVLEIGDIIYGFDGVPCRNYAEYIAMKEALTTDRYVVDVLRIDGETGVWEQLKLELTKDMPRVYMNDLVYHE